MKARNYLLGALLATSVCAAFADDVCEDRATKQPKADAQLKKAQELQKAGKSREAHAAASQVDMDCVGNMNAVDALKKSAAGVIAADEEQKARYAEAFDWYRRADRATDAGRMQRKLVATKSDDINTVAKAISYFHDIGDAAGEKDMRAHAMKNVDNALAAEEKQFASVGKNSLDALGKARDWSNYADAGKARAMARADQRGDTLAAEESRTFLELALNYYGFAEKKDKQQKLRDKARGLGDRAAAKGETELAVGYYHIAGENDKAQALRKRGEQQQAQTEEARKKQFSKEQDELEKELDLK